MNVPSLKSCAALSLLNTGCLALLWYSVCCEHCMNELHVYRTPINYNVCSCTTVVLHTFMCHSTSFMYIKQWSSHFNNDYDLYSTCRCPCVRTTPCNLMIAHYLHFKASSRFQGFAGLFNYIIHFSTHNRDCITKQQLCISYNIRQKSSWWRKCLENAIATYMMSY